jgi:hypothetical protein
MDSDRDGHYQWWSTVGLQQEREEMSLKIKASTGGGDFLPLSEGTHIARCFAVIDLGTQKREYQGQVKERQEVRLSWEIPGERMADGRPMSISKTYTASMHEKAKLREDLEKWRNKRFTDAEIRDFAIWDLLGRACQIGVIHTERDGKTFANINSFMPLPKGVTAPPAENEQIKFDLDDFDPQLFNSFTKYVQSTISASPEYQQAIGRPTSKALPGTIDDDDIPF